MSQFSYSEYTTAVTNAQQQSAKTSSPRVGFFKLPNDGDEALVRINCGSVDSLDFASVHTISTNGRWIKVSCLNPLGINKGTCELCQAVTEGNTSISRAAKKVYLQMLVSYKDRATGTWSAPQPVIWERPAAFSREIANKLRDYGDLRQVLLKVTRNGKAGDMNTTYSLDYAVPTIFKPELVPADFSAFANFNISKHSYWEKTPEEIHTFLTTGSFPEVTKNTVNESTQVQHTQPQSTPQPQVSQPIQQPNYNYGAPQPGYVENQYQQQPVTQPVQQQPVASETPRNFGGSKFSF